MNDIIKIWKFYRTEMLLILTCCIVLFGGYHTYLQFESMKKLQTKSTQLENELKDLTLKINQIDDLTKKEVTYFENLQSHFSKSFPPDHHIPKSFNFDNVQNFLVQEFPYELEFNAQYTKALSAFRQLQHPFKMEFLHKEKIPLKTPEKTELISNEIIITWKLENLEPLKEFYEVMHQFDFKLYIQRVDLRKVKNLLEARFEILYFTRTNNNSWLEKRSL